MTKRKKNKLFVQLLLLVTAFLLIYFTYYNKDQNEEKTSLETSELKKNNEKKKTNFFENIEYKGIDFNGNRYIVKSERANFNTKTSELVNMEIMTAYFYFKDGTDLKVTGDYGTYNNLTKDIKFRSNVQADYGNNNLYADNLDYLNSKKLLTIYGNIIADHLKGNMQVDSLIIDLEKETVNASMFSDNQVNLELRN